MAANLQQQMAAAGQLMPQQSQPGRPNQAQLGNLVYRSLMANTLAVQGWQTAVPITERMGKTLNLITNIILAMPSAEWQKAASYGLEFEKDAFHNSPDKNSYDQKMNAKNAEMFKKRQANEQNLQSTLNAQAAAQAAQQQQQQQLLLNQQNAALQAQMGRGMGQPNQQGFQHLQHPMQLSQIPQTPQQQMAMNMTTPGAPQMPPNQPQFPMTGGQMRQPGISPIDLGSLNPQDRVKVMEEAQRIAAGTPDVNKNQIRISMQSRMNPQQLNELRAQNRDPLSWYFQQQAFVNLQKQARARMMQRQQGMPPNGQNPMMQLAAQQGQRQMTPNMMGQPGGQLGPFANMGDILSEQKAGFMAQDAGQLVVPASSGPNRNATPQPMSGLPAQNMPNGGNQTPRPPQMQQAYNLQQAQMKMDQAAAQSQAQIRAQAAAKQLQGQPGGLGGPIPASQSPAMNTLNSAVARPPVPMGQMDNQMMGRGNPQFNQGLDPRNQQRPQISMTGNINNVNAMLAAMPVEQRQRFNGLPPEKLNELMTKWQEQQRNMQMNNAAQAGKNQPQMQGRPGQPGPGQFPANAANQFGMPNGMPQQNGGVPNAQQAFIQQQIARARMTAGQNGSQQQTMMDSMDIPPPVGQLFGGSLPMEIKKWRDLKMYLNQNQIPQHVKQQLATLQQEQFRQILEKRSLAAQQANMPQGMQQPAGPMAGPNPNMPQSMPNIPAHVLQVTPQEVQQLRQQYPKLQGATDDTIRKLAMKVKADSYIKSLQAKQNAGNQPGASQPQVSQPAQPQPGAAQAEAVPAPQPMSNPPAAAPKQAPSAPETTNAAPAKKNAQQKAASQAASASAQQKNLKRPSTEDNDTPAQPQAQANASAQKPPQQPAQRPAGQGQPTLTPEQLARLTPDQRAKYEQMVRARQLQMTPEDVTRLKTLAAEEEKNQKHHPDIPMNPAEKVEIAEKLRRVGNELNKMGRAMGKWYAISRDESRARTFFRQRLRLFSQFHDKDKMQSIKDSFNMSSQEVDGVKAMLESMTKELANTYGKASRPNQPNAPAAGQPAAAQNANSTAQQAQPAPLSEANLVKNTQALNKMHQRSGSKSGQPPAAPTTTQAPFAFGAASPHGQPSYIGKPAVTQEDLHLPPQRKKMKTGAQSSSPAISTAPGKPSPESKRQAVPESKASLKPHLLCPEPDCEYSTTGFPTEEARKAHIEEEHVKPFKDPIKFVEENLAASLGLDAQGRSKTSPNALKQDGSQVAAAAMTTSLSKQGLTPLSKAELVSTPMSRTASMNRQASAAGGKPADNGAKGKATRSDNTPKPSDSNVLTPAKTEAEPIFMPLPADPWAGSTIDPQSLMASFAPTFDTAAGGVISDMSLFRSLTPNDTPESSKDSGTSEPNSDISEGVHLDIDLNWAAPVDTLLVDMDNINMDANLDSFFITEPEMMVADPVLQNFSWDDVTVDFNKPLTFDTSLYSMDTL